MPAVVQVLRMTTGCMAVGLLQLRQSLRLTVFHGLTAVTLSTASPLASYPATMNMSHH